MINKLMSAASAVVITLGLLGVIQAPTANADDHSGQDPKVFVCKYVGTPEEDERLQTGDNPISVSANATSGAAVGEFFNDKQGRSFVLAIDDTEPGPEGDPDVSECPVPEVPTPTPNTTVNAACVPSEQVVRLTFINSGKAESNISLNGAASKVAAGATVNLTTPITGATVTVNVVIDGKAQNQTVTCPAGGSGNVTTSGGQGQITTTATPVVSGRGSVVTSLPVTSGSSTQIAALTVLLGSALAGAATYVVRARSGFSL